MRVRRDLLGQPYGLCVFCHDAASPTLLTIAHHHHKRERLANPSRPDINRSSALCWSCHIGLLHAGIITIEEVLEAEAATLAGTRKVTHDEVYRQIAIDLAAGRRRIDHRALHNSAPEKISERALRASKTRLARQGGKVPAAIPDDLIPT